MRLCAVLQGQGLGFSNGRTRTIPRRDHQSNRKLAVVETDVNPAASTFQAEFQERASAIGKFEFIDDLHQSDICVVYAGTAVAGLTTLQSLRRDPTTFLQPVLYLFEEENDAACDLADETAKWPLGTADLGQKMAQLETIRANLNKLTEIAAELRGVPLRKLLALRYLHTRPRKSLRPVRSFSASVGYSYPVLQALLEVQQGVECQVTEALEDAQLLTGDLVDRVNICPYCEHTQLNFREICPNCNSIDVVEETAIHHYRCSYIGRESEFHKGSELVCPKCTHGLRHIGVDYDKPADVLWCNSCKYNFSEPKLSCFCLHCGRTADPQDVFVKSIKNYSLTREGTLAAEEGSLPGYGLISILKKELGFYKRQVFADYVQLEMARCQRYKYDSTVARFNLTDANASLEAQPLKHSKKLRSAVAAIIKETFRTTDLFTDSPDGQLLSLFTNTDSENSNIAFQRLNKSLEGLLDRPLALDYQLYDLVAGRDQLNEYLGTIQ